MARIKHSSRGVVVNQTMTLLQLEDLGIKDVKELEAVKIPSLPIGVKPSLSGFWSAMSKRKHFRLRRRKYGN